MPVFRILPSRKVCSWEEATGGAIADLDFLLDRHNG